MTRASRRTAPTPRRRSSPAIRWRRVAAAAALLPLLAACTGKATASQGLQPRSYQAGDGAVKIFPAGQRPPAPPVRGGDLARTDVGLRDFTGDIVVVNFWASWCAPCIAEAPTLAHAAREFAPLGVSFLGVDFRNDDRGNAVAFERRYHIDYPSIYDPTSSTVLAFPIAVRPVAIPTTLIIDRQQRVAAVIFGGPVLYTTLRSLIVTLAREQG